jgi:YggT family protein
MGRPWWYDSDKRRQRRFRLPRRKTLVWIGLALLSFFLATYGTGFHPEVLAWILGFVTYFCRILAICVLVAALLSWFRIGGYNLPMAILDDITDPILRPLRRVMPTFGGLDFSPFVAVIILYFIPSIISRIVFLFV